MSVEWITDPAVLDVVYAFGLRAGDEVRIRSGPPALETWRGYELRLHAEEKGGSWLVYCGGKRFRFTYHCKREYIEAWRRPCG